MNFKFSKRRRRIEPVRESKMKIQVSWTIEQSDFRSYFGSIIIGSSKLNFEMTYHISTQELAETESIKDSLLRNYCQLELKRGESIIELTDFEFQFFLALIFEFTLRYDLDPQTQKKQAKIMFGNFRKETNSKAGVSVSLKNINSLTLESDHARMLRALKFGCKI